jgi:hypothetical protein
LVRLGDVTGLDDSSAKARAEGGGIDGDLGCVEAESAQSTARISRCAGGCTRKALRLQRRGLRLPHPRPGPSRLFTVTANNNGAVSAAINMLVAVQGLWIIWLICIRHDARPRSEPGANIRYGLLLS